MCLELLVLEAVKDNRATRGSKHREAWLTDVLDSLWSKCQKISEKPVLDPATGTDLSKEFEHDDLVREAKFLERNAEGFLKRIAPLFAL